MITIRMAFPTLAISIANECRVAASNCATLSRSAIAGSN